MSAANQRLKLLYLARILQEETDEGHGLTCPQLCERLAERGIKVERKTFYRDIQSLIDFGYDIQKIPHNPVEYALVTREFQDQELILMADAVQSSKFLTQRKADTLVAAIEKLGSKHLAASLKKRIHVEGRIKAQNESVFYNIDAIGRAISMRRKVEFKYFQYDANKKRVLRRNGAIYKETPVQLLYTNDCYYLVAWSEQHESFVNYRVDRMLSINVSEEEATRNKSIAAFDATQYQQRSFDMFNGQPTTVTLLAKASAMNAVVDRFGEDVLVTPAEKDIARVHVTIMESPTFYGWLAQFGEDITIEAPQSTRAAYAAHLHSILRSYGSSGESAPA